jgi:transcriptional regulator with XRE-family HTH domain
VTGLGARIRSAREAAGLSQPELARRVGTSQSQIWSWEAERKMPRLDSLALVATTLGVSADWLLGIESA